MRTALAEEKWDDLLGGKSVYEQWRVIADSGMTIYRIDRIGLTAS